MTSVLPREALSAPTLFNRISLAGVTSTPVLLRGLKVSLDKPFQFEFIIDPGQANADRSSMEQDAQQLVKYFLAAMTVPEKDFWVNLSPHEPDRIIPDAFGQTAMGRDLLVQDYWLKQLTASLLHPDNEVGKQFWEKVYARAFELYGTTDIPVETFHKVWIVPSRAELYEGDGAVYVTDAKMEVMLAADYEAERRSLAKGGLERDFVAAQQTNDHRLMANDHSALPNGKSTVSGRVSVVGSDDLSSEIMRSVVISAIKHEVNHGAIFAQLRQIYHALILATWYKKKMRDHIVAQHYADQNRIDGVEMSEGFNKDQIYQQYLDAFKQGVHEFVREERDGAAQDVIARHYFAGGIMAPEDGLDSVFKQAARLKAYPYQWRMALDVDPLYQKRDPGDKGVAINPGSKEIADIKELWGEVESVMGGDAAMLSDRGVDPENVVQNLIMLASSDRMPHPNQLPEGFHENELDYHIAYLEENEVWTDENANKSRGIKIEKRGVGEPWFFKGVVRGERYRIRAYRDEVLNRPVILLTSENGEELRYDIQSARGMAFSPMKLGRDYLRVLVTEKPKDNQFLAVSNGSAYVETGKSDIISFRVDGVLWELRGLQKNKKYKVESYTDRFLKKPILTLVEEESAEAVKYYFHGVEKGQRSYGPMDEFREYVVFAIEKDFPQEDEAFFNGAGIVTHTVSDSGFIRIRGGKKPWNFLQLKGGVKYNVQIRWYEKGKEFYFESQETGRVLVYQFLNAGKGVVEASPSARYVDMKFASLQSHQKLPAFFLESAKKRIELIGKAESGLEYVGFFNEDEAFDLMDRFSNVAMRFVRPIKGEYSIKIIDANHVLMKSVRSETVIAYAVTVGGGRGLKVSRLGVETSESSAISRIGLWESAKKQASRSRAIHTNSDADTIAGEDDSSFVRDLRVLNELTAGALPQILEIMKLERRLDIEVVIKYLRLEGRVNMQAVMEVWPDVREVLQGYIFSNEDGDGAMVAVNENRQDELEESLLQKEYGGIDFDPEKIEFDVRGQDHAMMVPQPEQAELNFSASQPWLGVSFRITHLENNANVSLFLGL